MRWCSVGGRRDADRVGAGGEGARLGLRGGGRSAGAGRWAPTTAAAGRVAGESGLGAQRRPAGRGAVGATAARRRRRRRCTPTCRACDGCCRRRSVWRRPRPATGCASTRARPTWRASRRPWERRWRASRTRPEAALAGLEAALSFWQGDTYAEFGGEWWAQGEAAPAGGAAPPCPRGAAPDPLGVGSQRGGGERGPGRHGGAPEPGAGLADAGARVVSLRPSAGEAFRTAGEYRARLRDDSGLDPSSEFAALEHDVTIDAPRLEAHPASSSPLYLIISLNPFRPVTLPALAAGWSPSGPATRWRRCLRWTV